MSTDKRINTKKKVKVGGKRLKRSTIRVQTVQPWRQHHEEGPKSYQAFAAFRDMGPGRSLKLLAQKGYVVPGPEGGLKKLTYNTLTSMSGKFDWAHRAGAYDRSQDKVRLKQNQEAGKRAGRRAAAIAEKFQLASWKLLKSAYRRIEDDEKLVDKFEPTEFIDMVIRLGKLQKDLQAMNRLTFGEPTEIVLSETPTAPGGLFNTSQDFMLLVRSDNEAADLFSQLNSRVSTLRGEADKARDGLQK